MKMRINLPLLFTLLCLTLAVVPAMAQSFVYTNGGPATPLNGFTISGNVVSDSVFCGNPAGCIPHDLLFYFLGPPLENPNLTDVVWQFTTAPFGGTGLGSGVATFPPNSFSCSPSGNCAASIDPLIPLTAGVLLPFGTSWLNLHTTNVDADVDWSVADPNAAMSEAWTVENGVPVMIPSEAFTVRGEAVPEPGSIMLLGSGILGSAGVLRRKLMR